jgi:hypothetical protein
MRCRLMALLAVALPLSLCAQESGRVVVPAVSMKDQYDRPHDVKEFRGDVAVLIYGSQSSASANSELGAKLHVHFHPAAKGKSAAEAQKAPVKPVAGAPAGPRSPDVKTVPIACHKTASEVAQGVIRGIVRANAGGVPVWLDFNGVMSANFPYKEGVPNVVVLDAKGRYRYAAAGQPTAEGVERLVAVIEQLRKEAMAP